MSTGMTNRTWLAVLGVVAALLAPGVALAGEGAAKWQMKQDVVADGARAERMARTTEVAKVQPGDAPAEKGTRVIKQGEGLRVVYPREREAKQ